MDVFLEWESGGGGVNCASSRSSTWLEKTEVTGRGLVYEFARHLIIYRDQTILWSKH